MFNFLSDFRNTIDFCLRQNIHFSKKNYSEKNEIKDDITEYEKYLLEKYSLTEYRNNSTYANYYQNLYTLEFLDKYLSAPKNENLAVLDIGSKNWFYAQGEYSYFKKYSKILSLDGIELDAYRLYSNFYNRYEVAKYYTKNLEGTNYIAGDMMKTTKLYDYIIWILPFVIIEPLQAWGLPNRYFKPQEMFNHALSLLKDNGKMIIINQGEKEFEEQKRIASGNIIQTSELDSSFYKYKNKRFISIIGKNSDI